MNEDDRVQDKLNQREDAQETVKANIQSSARRSQEKAQRASDAVQRELSLDGFPPAIVGLLRGLIHAMVMGALSYVSAELSNASEVGAVGAVATIGVAVVRAVEGILDGKLLGAPRSAHPLGGGRPKK